MTAAIANGGTLYKPHVVSAFIDPATKEKTINPPAVLRSQVVSKRTIAAVQKGMRDCVESSSCRQLKRLNIRAGGKTGTAQWNATKDNHAWFPSYAPAEKPTKDDELKGSGNSYNFGARIFDPRLGRWLSVDPLQIKYPGWSPLSLWFLFTYYYYRS